MRKNFLNVFILFAGIVLVIIGMLINEESYKSIIACCYGIGISFIGIGLSRIITRYNEKKHPEIAKQMEIELVDERNTMIREKAKAKAGDITQWLVMGMAWINILIDGALWFTLLLVLIFASKSILVTCFTNHYQDIM